MSFPLQLLLAELPEMLRRGGQERAAPAGKVSRAAGVRLRQGQHGQRQALEKRVIRQNGNAEPGGYQPGDHGILLSFHDNAGGGVDGAEQGINTFAQAAAGGKADLWVGQSILQGNAVLRGERVPLRRDDHKGSAPERDRFKFGRVAGVGGESEIQPSFLHGFEQVGAEPGFAAQLELGGGILLCAEIPHQAGHQGGAQGADAAQQHQPAALAGFLHRAHSGIQCIQRALDGLQKLAAIAGQPHAAPGFFKQRNAKLLLHLGNRIVQAGLADMQLLRRLAVMLQTGQNFKIAQMVKTPVFWVMLVMFIFANAAGTMMVSATSPIAQQQIGQSAMTAAMCVSIMTLANMCGRIGFGFIYDKLKGWNSLILVLVINGISMCMLTVAKSLPYFILCICLVGFSFGGLLVVFAPIVKNVFGSRFYNRNYGLIFIGYGIGAFVGPKISASFYDSTGSYVVGYLGSAILAAAAVVLVFAARKLTAAMQSEKA